MMFDITEELESWVKCPWGCSEFMSECGMVSYFHVMKHYSSDFIWCKELLPTQGSVKYKDNVRDRSSNLSRLYGARPDYVSC
eukprot:15051356-Ditylum_brightwellii.AAC.1